MSQTIDFGIDLGTTNSSIAVCRRGEVRVFQSVDQMNVTPSVVYVSRTGRMLVGKKAYDTWVADPANTQAEFKRWMGYSDRLTFPASGRTMTAEELSAEVLKSLRADAERQAQEQVTSAVITVPAAFSSLQCDATGRAAKLAGLTHAPLLQEPVAAAIAAGANPAAHDQRWLVFDLGGGTLDIAVVSTRNGRLAVLEHQGNNRLGGKDIDRTIAEQFLIKALAEQYRLPEDPTGRFARAVTRCAEQAKIVLSTAEQTTAEVFDVGDDADGNPIELAVPLRRADLEQAVGPLMGQCLDLVRRALAGARMSAAELDRVVLVGGPTQMPVVRAALKYALGDKLDASLDPMTVVSHGAALFASTVEKPGAAAAAAVAAAPPPARGTVAIRLAYERASGTPQSPVAGLFDPAAPIADVKVDAAGGFWTSGWVPAAGGQFAVDVMLNPARPVTRFAVVARTSTGEPVQVDPPEFTIASMLPMAAAPLPHTLAIELAGPDGKTRFDPVFKRNTPLPAEARRTYRADRTLRPSEMDATLPVKFWEVDVSDDPQEKWWAGCVRVKAEEVRRPILEGTDLELTVKIDASRKVSVELFVPLLNQSFSNDVYVPDPPAAGSHLHQELDACFDRLNKVGVALYSGEHDDAVPVFRRLQRQAEQIAERAAGDRSRAAADPDAALATTDAVRKLRVQLTQLEEQLNLDSTGSAIARKLRLELPYFEGVLNDHGTPAQQEEFVRLRGQLDRYLSADDARGLKWVYEQVQLLHMMVFEDKPFYWHNQLSGLRRRRFVNQDEAAKALAEGEAASRGSDLPAVKVAVRKLWKLLPRDQVQDADDRGSQSGLRGE